MPRRPGGGREGPVAAPGGQRSCQAASPPPPPATNEPGPLQARPHPSAPGLWNFLLGKGRPGGVGVAPSPDPSSSGPKGMVHGEAEVSLTILIGGVGGWFAQRRVSALTGSAGSGPRDALGGGAAGGGEAAPRGPRLPGDWARERAGRVGGKKLRSRFRDRERRRRDGGREEKWRGGEERERGPRGPGG